MEKTLKQRPIHRFFYRHTILRNPDRAWNFVVCSPRLRSNNKELTVDHPHWNGYRYTRHIPKTITRDDLRKVLESTDFLTVISLIDLYK